MTAGNALWVMLLAPGVPPLADAGEQAAWGAIVARFSGEISSKGDAKSGITYSVKDLKGTMPPHGMASVKLNASGRVVQVTADRGDFATDEFKHFAAFTELEALTLWHNFAIGAKTPPANSDGSGLKHLMKLEKLTRVTLAGGHFNDDGMAVAAKLPHLKELHAWHARFTDAGVAHFAKHPTLEVIKMGPMWVNDLTDKTLEHLCECPRLKHIKLNETYLTWEKGLSHLVKLKGTLTTLELGNALIETADVDKLRAAMPGTKITWDGFAAAGQAIGPSGWTYSKAAKWIPKAILDRAIAEGSQLPKPIRN